MEGDGSILPASLREAWESRCLEYWCTCDPVNKGFITKKDFFALKTILHFNDEQMDHIFDTIDAKGNGKLTFDEFQQRTFDGILEILQNENTLNQAAEEHQLETGDDDEAYTSFIRGIGAEELLADEASVREMWLALYRGGNEELLRKFEETIETFIKDKENGLEDFNALRNDLCRKANLLKEQERLFEENAREIQSETEQLLKKCRERENLVRKELEEELRAKDEKLEQLMKNEYELEVQLRRFQHLDDTKDKEELLQERAELRKTLEYSKQDIFRLNDEIGELKINIEKQKHEQFQCNTDVSEGISKIFEKLSEISKQLMAERTTQSAYGKMRKILRERRRPDVVPEDDGQLTSGDFDSMGSSLMSVEPISRQGSRIGNYLHGPTSMTSNTDTSLNTMDYEVDDHFLNQNPDSSNFNVHSGLQVANEDHRDKLDAALPDRRAPEVRRRRQISRSPRKAEQPAAKVDQQIKYYRVVTLGDTGVGKTVFIKRFCNHLFHVNTLTTIVPDMETRTMEVNGKTFGLELWGTAGQEKFHSVASSILIKADGAIIMYDITDRDSFINTEEWITLIRLYKEEPVIMIVGTKLDLAEESSDKRQVSYREGAQLAKEHKALFFETSSRTGFNIEDSMRQLTEKLHESLGEEIIRAIQLAFECKDPLKPPQGPSSRSRRCLC